MFRLGDQGEPSSNKKTDVDANKTSDTFFPTVKAVFDWVSGLFVKGAASSTDNAVVRFDGVTGKLVQNNGAMFITDTGNVGIGTASPKQKLDIVGDSGANGVQLRLASNDTDGSVKNARIVAGTYTNSDRPMLLIGTINNAGQNNICIGGIPGANAISAATSITFSTAAILNSAGGTARMLIDYLGNVGIGTTSPTAKLDVDGTSRFRDTATFNSQIIDSTGSAGTNGQVLKNVAGLPVWSNP